MATDMRWWSGDHFPWNSALGPPDSGPRPHVFVEVARAEDGSADFSIEAETVITAYTIKAPPL